MLRIFHCLLSCLSTLCRNMLLCTGSFRNAVAVKMVIVLFLQSSYYLGTLKSFGVFLPELERTLGITPADIGLTLGLFSAFSFGPGPIVAYLYRRLQGENRRLLVMTGAILAPGGLILGSFVTNNGQLAACLSAAGLGSCVLSLSIVVAFRTQCGAEDIGCLLGFGRSGYAIGMSLVPQLADYLMELYGWRGSLMMIGALMGHMIPLTMIIDIKERGVMDSGRRQEGNKRDLHNNQNVKDSSKDDLGATKNQREVDDRQIESLIYHEDTETYSSEEPNTLYNSKKQHGDTFAVFDDDDRTGLLEKSSRRQELTEASDHSRKNFMIETQRSFKNVYQHLKKSSHGFDRYVTSLMIIQFVYHLGNGGWCSFLIPHAVARGVPTKKALYIVYSSAGGSFVGRIFGGVFLRFRKLTPLRYFLILTILNIAALLSDVLIPRFEVMVTMSFINAVTLAERGILNIVIFADQVSERDFALVLALADVMHGVGMGLGAWFSGLLADAFGSLEATFIFITATEVLVFVLWLPLVVVEFMYGCVS